MCNSSFYTFTDATVAVTNNNDRGSRQYHTQAAASNPPASYVHCQHGGPSGGGLVGTTTQAWGTMAGIASCQAIANYSYIKAEVLNAITNFNFSDLNVIVPMDTNAGMYSTAVTTGNTDTCRIYHLTAATQIPNPHCPHGDLTSGFPGVCVPAQTPACLMVQQACGTTNYATQAACETAFLAYITAGKIGDPTVMAPTDDSIACRLYFAITALVAKKMGGMAATVAPCKSAMIAGSQVCGANSSMPPSMMKSSASSLAVFPVALLLSLLL